MKKKFLIVATALMLAGGAFTLGACSGGNNGGNQGGTDTEQGTTPEKPNPDNPDTETPVKPALKKFEGLTLSDGTAVYDGQAHPLAVAGTQPSGTKVTYSENNNSKDAGSYSVSATLACEGYETLTLTATLKIEKAVMSGLTFNGGSFNYDGNPHSIELSGVTPEGSDVTYSCKENPSLANSATETGEYTVTVTVTNKNYVTFTAEAKIKINAEEKDRHIYAFDGKLYFANALDGDRLYSYDATDGVKKISGDVPQNFTVMGGSLYFRSYTPFASSVKTVGDGGVDTVISQKGEYLCSDGANLYYAVNSLTNAKSGIYRVNLTSGDPDAALISAGKAHHLVCAGDYIYFADGANGNKLSRVAKSGGARSVAVDEKISCLTYSGGALYYTVDNLAGNYIEKYTVASGSRRKLTSDAGANLTVIGSQLYYINVDLLNSYLFGKGIYKVNTNPVVDSNLAGTRVIGDGEQTYSSLTVIDGKLAYYRVNDQMLCLNTVDGNGETEILAGFTAPETTPISTGGKTAAYGKYIFFTDLYNGKALYRYDTVKKVSARVTSDKVSDFAILGDTLYYNCVSYGVNNDLYKVDLKLGGEPELVSANDCNSIVTDGNKVFYVKENAAGAATAVTEIAADGTETDIFTKGVSNLTYYDGYLYFVYKNKLNRMPVNGYTADQCEEVTHKDVSHVDAFVIDGGVVYFRELYGLAWGFKRLSKMNVDGTGYSVLLTENTDPLELEIYGNYIYYYNDVAKGTSGLYKISKNGGQAELILDCENKYYASTFTVMENKIYFINFRLQLGDSHLYCVDISDKTVEKIA